MSQSQSSASSTRDGRGKDAPLAQKKGLGLGIDDHSTRKSFSIGRASAIGNTGPRVSIDPKAAPSKAHTSVTAPAPLPEEPEKPATAE